jgi:hypothetical protein
MLLQKFLNLIDETPIGRAVSRKEELIDQLDPERIYVENVRSFFGVPFGIAQLLCEMAVRERLFLRRYGVMCPYCDRIIVSVKSEKDIPDRLLCEVCERNERDRYEYSRSECALATYYKLNEHDH